MLSYAADIAGRIGHQHVAHDKLGCVFGQLWASMVFLLTGHKGEVRG